MFLRKALAISFLILSSIQFAVAVPKPAENPPQPGVPAKHPKSVELNEKGTAAAQAKDFKQAEQLLQQAVALDPHNLTAVYNLSGVYLQNKKHQQSIALLQDYTEKRGVQDAGLFARLGDSYFATKEINKAAESYEKAIALDPKYPGAHAKLGTLYTLSNRLVDAEAMLLLAIEEKPRDSQLLSNLSSIFLANNKLDKAISTAKRALQIGATSDLYITLGNAYELQEDYRNALIAFQRAADLGDKSEELKKKIAGLKEAVPQGPTGA